MASKPDQIHFVMIPLMAQGHLIPTVDMARILAQRGVTVTIVTTHLNAKRLNMIIDRAIESGLKIRLFQLRFPCIEAGLPEGCENLDVLPSRDLSKNFFHAASILRQPLEQCLKKLQPQPSCIISDRYLAWTAERVSDSKAELTKAQLPNAFNPGSVVLKDLHQEIKAAELTAHGLIVNTFEELEPEYIKEYKKLKRGNVWCIGPVSLYNKDNLDKSQRGNKASIHSNQCLKRLDSRSASSVLYVCLGTLSCIEPQQLIELGLALEASNRPFIWVIRKGYKSDEVEKWISKERFEERTKGRSFLIWGWAPQVLILSHQAIGGFLTHCGWNSTLEGVCAGLPMITWPLFSEQFFNEKFVVQVLSIGVSVGADFTIKWGDEEKYEVMVKRYDIKKAIDMLMDAGEEGEKRRKRARELGDMASKAVEAEGSSYQNITLLIEDTMRHAIAHKAKASLFFLVQI
uniref:Glycosyltransferase n=1 Tax=Fagus sylvatica TaxID=28930 RepID=A0A2N9GP51_FAGSY